MDPEERNRCTGRPASSLQAADQFLHDKGHLWFRPGSDVGDIIQGNFHDLSRNAQVGYDGNGKTGDPHLVGNNDLGYGGHADRIAPDDPEILVTAT